MRLRLIIACLATIAATLAHATTATEDYPTSTRAEYVFACMKMNGETRESLDKCACSIDVIASLLPYDAYVAAETVAALEQGPGRIAGAMRDTQMARDDLTLLRRAQAEAEVRCF
jgi:hypothetical protein